MGNAVVDVIDGARQVVGRGSVGAKDHKVVDIGMVEAQFATHEVFEHRLAWPGHREPDREGLTRPRRDLLRRGAVCARIYR
ncbi:MAG: hypothetical protein A2146_08600 [Actinobacteria bacterium RBG_16_67_10]|nr:MAG: hypothetical protein A2146_08600 [Actinobacteria bacterium RBG_16_67_10]